MKGKFNLKSVIVVVILLLVGVLGVLGMNTAKTFLGSAAAGVEPVSVVAKPGTDGKSATVTWSSDKASMGIVEYGTTPASLLLRAVETTEVTSHRVELTPLKSGVTYYYRIRVGDDVFDNSGIPYSFKTGASAVAAVSPTVAVTTIPVSPQASSSDCAVDYNLDGRVSTAERLCCANRNQIGQGACQTNVDYTCDGVVNDDDKTCCQVRLSAKTGECQSGTDYNCDGKTNFGDLAECSKIKASEL